MQNHICAKHQGPLEDRAGEGIVDNELRARLMSNIGDRADVQDLHEGIRWRFDPHDLCVGANRRLKHLQILKVFPGALDTPDRQEVADQVADIDIDVVGKDDVRARSDRRVELSSMRCVHHYAFALFLRCRFGNDG
jgi:hypothetical protein